MGSNPVISWDDEGIEFNTWLKIAHSLMVIQLKVYFYCASKLNGHVLGVLLKDVMFI